MKLTVLNTKGGVGKTTTAIYIATGLHASGRTLLVDSDPQQSALTWSECDPGLPFDVVALPVRDLHKRIASLSQGYANVVIDTPPQDLGIIRSAILAADLAIVPMSPSGLDLNRMRPTWDLLAELESTHPVEVGILLTRVRKGTLSARGIREILAEIGYPVLDTEIPLAEMYAASFGSMPADLGRYEQLLKELTA